jgi:hypothetical protein
MQQGFGAEKRSARNQKNNDASSKRTASSFPNNGCIGGILKN